MSLFIVLLCIAFLILLISYFKVNAFLAFLIISILAGWWLGMEPTNIIASVQKGIGDTLAGLVIVIVCGAMLGKLTAESGAAQQITSGLMKLFGERYIQWALMTTGFIIGIPLFYNVGFVLVVPLIFTVAYKYKLPVIYTAIPMLAALSVTHGFLPPHPSPTVLIDQFHADMGTTLFYGVLIAIPSVIIAGPVFSGTLKTLVTPQIKTFEPPAIEQAKLPGLANSIFSALLPVLLLALTSLPWHKVIESETLKVVITFFSNPAVIMVVCLLTVTFTLGLGQGMTMKRVMDIYGEAVKDIAMMLLIMGSAGALKQVLVDSKISDEIALALSTFELHPLLLAWLMACVIRVCVGSATVAGPATAGIIAPLMKNWPDIDPSLMVLSIGAGSLMFSHVNDSGFWLFKEYFNLSIKQTIRSWSLMETVVSLCGIIGVMIIHYLIS
jgi:Gnt-I system high-affinity gluconate transporter